MNMKTLLFTAVLAAIAVGAKAQQSSEPALVTVNGEHTIKVAPDEAEVRFTVSSKLKEAPEAQKANDAIVAKVLAYLSKQGIDKSDIRTTRVSLHPYTEYVKDKESKQLYMVQQAITFRVEDLDKLAGLLSGLVDLGVNNIDHVDFKASNMKEFQKKARAEAVLDAKEKAEILAARSEEHTSELQSLMRNSYAVFCLKTKKYEESRTSNTDT